MTDVLNLNVKTDEFDAIARGEQKKLVKPNTSFWQRSLLKKKFRSIRFHRGATLETQDVALQLVLVDGDCITLMW